MAITGGSIVDRVAARTQSPTVMSFVPVGFPTATSPTTPVTGTTYLSPSSSSAPLTMIGTPTFQTQPLTAFIPTGSYPTVDRLAAALEAIPRLKTTLAFLNRYPSARNNLSRTKAAVTEAKNYYTWGRPSSLGLITWNQFVNEYRKALARLAPAPLFVADLSHLAGNLQAGGPTLFEGGTVGDFAVPTAQDISEAVGEGAVDATSWTPDGPGAGDGTCFGCGDGPLPPVYPDTPIAEEGWSTSKKLLVAGGVVAALGLGYYLYKTRT